MAIDVNAQVASQMELINTSIAHAVGEMDTVYENLESLSAAVYPPFIIPSEPALPVTTITVSAEAPDDLEIQGELVAISAAAPEPFKPAGKGGGLDQVEKTFLDWIPRLEDITKEEAKLLRGYDSALIDAMTAKLLRDIESGGTGLSSAVAQAIPDRQAQRDAQIYQDARDKMASTFSAPGWELPDSVLAAMSAGSEREAGESEDRPIPRSPR